MALMCVMCCQKCYAFSCAALRLMVGAFGHGFVCIACVIFSEHFVIFLCILSRVVDFCWASGSMVSVFRYQICNQSRNVHECCSICDEPVREIDFVAPTNIVYSFISETAQSVLFGMSGMTVITWTKPLHRSGAKGGGVPDKSRRVA